MASLKDITDFIETSASEQGLAGKLVFVELTDPGLQIYKTLPTTAPKSEISALLKDWHEEGATFPVYIAHVSVKNKVLSVQEIKISAWMEKQYEKQYEKK